MFLTFRFIEDAKYHMGSLGFKPKTIENFDQQILKDLVVDKIFRLKNLEESFHLNYHYSWIVKHWKKLTKIFVNDKWQQANISYSRIDVSLCKDKYENVSFVTNMFDNKYEGFSLDENGKVVSNVFDKKVKKDKNTIVDIVHDDESTIDYVYTTEYLNSLKKKEYADTNYSIASIDLYCVDYNKNKYISYITYDTEKINKLEILNYANNSLQKEVNRKVQMQSMLAIGNLIMLQNMQRITRIHSASTFNINGLNRF